MNATRSANRYTLQRKNSLPRKKAKGFTLIELMVVVFFALAIIGGIVYKFGPVITATINTVIEGYRLQQAQSNFKNAFQSNNNNYSTLSNANAIIGGWVPDGWKDGTATGLLHKWGGTITLSGASINGGTNNAYQIVYANVPKTGCNSLVSSAGLSFETVTVGATAIKALGATTIVPATLAGACDNTANSITLVGR